MGKLLPKPIKPKTSKSEAAGAAAVKLRLKGMLPIPDAADYLGIHKYTLKEHVLKGFAEAFKVGSRHYLNEDELRRLRALIAKYGSLSQASKDPDTNNWPTNQW